MTTPGWGVQGRSSTPHPRSWPNERVAGIEEIHAQFPQAGPRDEGKGRRSPAPSDTRVKQHCFRHRPAASFENPRDGLSAFFSRTITDHSQHSRALPGFGRYTSSEKGKNWECSGKETFLVALLLTGVCMCQGRYGTFSLSPNFRVSVLIFNLLLYPTPPKLWLSASPPVSPGTWGPPTRPCAHELCP